MPKYFANKNKLVPSREDQENGLQPLDSLSGIFISSNVRPGKSNSGFWLVLKIKRDYGYIDVFFDALCVGETEIDRYEILRGKAVSIKSVNESPNIETVGTESEESVRVSLLKGIAAGHIKMDDLPILLEVAKGKDVPFEKWDLFKLQIENEGLAKVKEDTVADAGSIRKEIEEGKNQLSKLEKMLFEVNTEKEKMLGELFSALMFLQGEEHPQGNGFGYLSANRPENLVSIGCGYSGLIASFEKFKTKKGVYVVCDDKVFLIHDAYLEKGGSAFLLGTHKEFRRTKQEEIKKVIDQILSLYTFTGSGGSFNQD